MVFVIGIPVSWKALPQTTEQRAPLGSRLASGSVRVPRFRGARRLEGPPINVTRAHGNAGLPDV